MRQVRRAVNRVVLGVVGLVLLAGGGLALVGGLGAVALPDGWPWATEDDVPLRAEDRTRWTDTGWWWPVVIAVLAVLVLLALWWLLAQFRSRRVREVLVDSGDGEGALLRGRALEDVLSDEAGAAGGVRRAVVRLVGRRREPEVRMRVLLEPHAEPVEVVATLADEAVAHARGSAGLAALPAEVRLRAARHRAERVA